MPDLLTKNEVARLLKVNPKTVDNWVRAGRLPAPVKMSRRAVRFVSSDIHKALAAMGLSADTPKALSSA
jgi:excisionase family DNA binding protein